MSENSDYRSYSIDLFRPAYRAPTAEELDAVAAIKAKADDLAAAFDRIRANRYRTYAITSLEQAVLWAMKGLAA